MIGSFKGCFFKALNFSLRFEKKIKHPKDIKKLSMDAIGSFLKTALYRVIFVLIVGIPAVEVFSFAIFGNGVLIQKVDSEDKTIPASVKLRFDKISFNLPYGGYGSVPGNMNISDQGSRGNNTYPVVINIPNADIRLFKDDATLQVKDGNVIDLKEFRFKIRELPTSGWILHLTIAWVLGEILCFWGESIIGLVFFDWSPFECRDGKIEKVCPDNNSCQNGNNQNQECYITPKDFLERQAETSQVGSNNLLLEISEVHFVLSRVLAGLSMLWSIPIGVFLVKKWIEDKVNLLWIGLLLISFIPVGLEILFIFRILKGLENFNWIKLLLVSLWVLFSIGAYIAAIIYRTHANKLLYYSTQNNGS